MASQAKNRDDVVCLARPPGLRKVNSETKFAVSLLLAVSGDTVATMRAASSNPSPSRRHDDWSENSGGSTEVATDASRRQSESPPKNAQLSSSVVLTTPPVLPRVRTTHTDGELFKYSYEERQAALRRFREKKRRRQFQKTVRYMVRKRLAETRPRYKGRFSKPPTASTPDAQVPLGTQDAKHSGRKEPRDGNK